LFRFHEEMTNREQLIFDAAIELFSKKGYSATTTKEIAELAGVAEGTIFRYYKTKKSILDSIVRRFIGVMGDIAVKPVEQIFMSAKDKDLKQILHDLMIDRLDLVDKLYPLVSIVMTEILFHDDLRELLYEKLIKRAIQSFDGFHDAMVERGLLRGDVPAGAAFRAIFANIMVFIAQHKLFPGNATREEIEKEFETVYETVLFGIATH